MQFLMSTIVTVGAVLICMSVHEASHALVAYLLGDKTAKNQGRLTLNPISHIDPFGFFLLVFLKFGWAKPVPVNHRNLKNPKRDSMIIALAGPVSNFILATILYFVGYALILIVYNDFTMTIAQFLITTASLSVGLGIFNLIPVPPLDGSHILMPILPRKYQIFMINNIQFIQFFMMIGLYFGILSKPIYYLRGIAIEGILTFVDKLLSIFF